MNSLKVDAKFILLFILTITTSFLIVSNLLTSDYFGDDLYNFYIPGLFPFQFQSPTELAIQSTIDWAKSGRFFPISKYVYYVFEYCQTVFQYKLFIVFLTVFNVFLFSYFIYYLTKSKKIFLVLLLITTSFIQYRYYHDPMLSFHGLLHVVWILTIVSLLFYCKYVETKKSYNLYLSALFYLFAITTYEISFAFIVLHLFIYLYYKKFKKIENISIYSLLPIIVTLTLMFILNVYLRSEANITSGPYKIDWELGLILKTFFLQVVSVLPTSYYFEFENYKDFYTQQKSTIFIPLVSFLFALVLVFVIKYKDINETIKKNISIVIGLSVFSILIMVLPATLISLSPKFYDVENNINAVVFAKPYLPIYIQIYGLSLLITIILVSLKKLIYKFIIYAALVCVLFIHLVSNNEVIKKVNIPFKMDRIALETLYKSDFSNELEAGQIINYLGTEKPFHYTDFIRMHTKKDIKAVINGVNYDMSIEYSTNKEYFTFNITYKDNKVRTLVFKNSDDHELVYDSFSKLEVKNSVSEVFDLFKNFHTWERGYGRFIWAKDNAHIVYTNTDNEAVKRKVSFNLGAFKERNIEIYFNQNKIDSMNVKPTFDGKRYTYELMMEPGKNELKFVSDKPAAEPSEQDRRLISFCLSFYKFEK